MRTLLAVLLLSVCACAQGIGGNAGMGGKAGIGGGATVGPPPTTVTYAGIVAGFSGGALNETDNLGVTPATGSAIVGFAAILNNASTLVSVCDGTGTDGCTGSSTYTIKPVFHLGTQDTYVFFTCNFVGTGAGIITITQTGVQGMYGDIVVGTGNTTTGTNCDDGYAQAQDAVGSTTYTSGNIVTTNAHDLLVGMFFGSGAGTFTAGAGYTLQDSMAGILGIETQNATTTGTKNASATGSSTTWNAMILAIK